MALQLQIKPSNPIARLALREKQVVKTTAPIKSGRNVTIDILRGYCIIMMITSHVSDASMVNQYIHFQRFISGAEGFVFLSGLVLGMVYRRKLDAAPVIQSYKNIWRRALMLWAVNCTIVLSALTANIWLFHFSDIPDIRTLGILHTIWLTVSLQLQPGHMLNILPMYVILLGIAPIAFELLRRGRIVPLLIASIGVFLYTQVNPAFLTWGDSSLGGVAFPPVMWQVLFLPGLCIGYHSRIIRSTILERNRTRLLWWLGAMMAIIMFVTLFQTRHFEFYSHTKWDLFLWQRQPLRFGRVLYFLLSVSFFYLLIQRLQKLPILSRILHALSTLGRNSLYSFLVHLGIAFVIGALMMVATDNAAIQLSPVFTVALVYLMAKHQVGRKFIPN